jgi:lysophospholipase L1-like esterase
MTTFAFIGDSVTARTRTGAWSAGQGWAALVSYRYGAVEQNYAVSGAFAAQMASQVNSALALFPLPDGLFIDAGENDIGVTSVAAFKATLDSYIQQAITAGMAPSSIVLLTPFIYPNSAYFAAITPYLQAIRDIAHDRGVGMIDIFDRFAEFGYTRSDFTSLYNNDGHPTIAGHVEIANLFNSKQYANVVGYTANPIVPISIMPVMTGVTTSGVTVSGNSLGEINGPEAGYLEWNLFANPSQTIQWNGVSVSAPALVNVDLGVGNSKKALQYTIKVRTDANAQAYSPKTWAFLGSNDNSTWITLDTRTAVPQWFTGEVRTYSLANATAYRYYRLTVSDSQTGGYLHIRGMDILA